MTGFQTWYGTNKKDFNAKRRERYKKDKDYRDRVQSYTRRNRSDDLRKILPDGSVVSRRANGEFVPCFRMGVTAKMLGVAPHIIRTLEKRSLIPMVGSETQRHMRYYTEYQIKLMRLVINVTRKNRIGQAPKSAVDKIVLDVAKEWDK